MATIIGIKVNDRMENAPALQSVLTKNGCLIKTRIGLHNSSSDVCTPYGIIILEVQDDQAALDIEKELLEISEIEIQRMVFAV